MREAVPKPLDALIEEARLKSLERYRVLSAANIAVLSRLAHEAARGLSATQAAVTFVDSSRIWFGGAFGFSIGDAAREHSFCDAVMRSAAPLLVPDGLADPRFYHHELVRATPGLRSYAGVPLIDSGGYTLGTVAVFSVAPASFTTVALRELGALATLVRDFLSDIADAPPERAALAPARKVQGWLGVRTKDEPGRTGLLIVSVARHSPAEEAGLRPTDIIHSIGGQAVSRVPDIAAAMEGRVMGSHVPVRFRRLGQWHECQVEIKPRRHRLGR